MCSCMETKKEKFVPIIWENEVYKQDSSLLNNDFCDNFIRVLTFYGHAFERNEKCDIFLTKDLIEDQDLLMNYTNKAKDVKWLQEHE